MYAGPFHQFHDARKKNTFPVTDGIHLHLFPDDITVDQHRPVSVDTDGIRQIPDQHLFVGDDLHRSSAQHIRRPDQHRVSDLFRRPDSFLYASDGLTLRMRDFQITDQQFEGIPVFRSADRFRTGTDDPYASFGKGSGQIDRRLSAQGSDHSFRLFQIADVQDIFHGQRLKIEFVRHGIIRGHCFRIIIDHDRLIAHFLYGLHGMYG